MRTNLQLLGVLGGVLVLMGLGVWYEVSLWRECMVDHSWWYCLRVLGR